MMNILREHDAGICMHGGFESTGSQVSHLKKEVKDSVHWFTGTTLPCLSIYKPYNFSSNDLEYLEPGPYTSIKTKWTWVKHSNYIKTLSKTQSFRNKLRDFESNKLLGVKNIEEVNKEMWEFTKKLIR